MLQELLIALSVFAAGIAVAFLIRWALRVLARRYAQAAPWLEENAFERGPWRVPVEAVFWAIVVAAVLTALRFLSTPVLAPLLDELLDWLPHVLLAFVALSVGIIGGRLLRNLIRHRGAATERESLAGMAEAVVVLFSVLIALGALGLEITWLAVGLAAIVVVAMGALFLVLALGTVRYMENLISMRVMGPRVSVGDRLQVGGVEGRVAELTASTVVLDTEDGIALIPGRQLQQEAVLILRATEERDE